MERKQVIVQRAHEFFGENLSQVLQIIRQDREDTVEFYRPGFENWVKAFK